MTHEINTPVPAARRRTAGDGRARPPRSIGATALSPTGPAPAGGGTPLAAGVEALARLR